MTVQTTIQSRESSPTVSIHEHNERVSTPFTALWLGFDDGSTVSIFLKDLYAIRTLGMAILDKAAETLENA